MLVVPVPGVKLLRTVSQLNSVTNTNQVVHFIVPKARIVRKSSTRITVSSLSIPSFGGDRLAPEYVSVRHQVNPAGPANQQPVDLNITLNAADFTAAMATGGYTAAHFADNSCDGCVEAVDGLAAAVPSFPAFSLVTAPDFFPLADQFEVESDPTISNITPLSKGRLPANPSLPLPSDLASFAFDRNDITLTALVGESASGPQASIIGQTNRAVSFLPDAASDIFAPGWDTSRSRDNVGEFLHQLGSRLAVP